MISLCMIIKDEEDVLARCLNSVREKLSEVVDEIIIVDTGSTDNSINIAKEHNCDIYNFAWYNDFSKARNYCIEKAKNDWILVLDADEYVDRVWINELINLQCGDYDNVRCYVTINNLSNDNDVENTTGTTNVPRVFNRNDFTYMYSIHEQVGVKPEVVEANDYILKMFVNHTGYTKATMNKKNKVERNKNMLLEFLSNNEEQPYMHGHLGTMYFQEGNYIEAIKHYKVAVFSDVGLHIEALTKYTIEYIECLLELEDYDNAIVCEELWEKCSYSDKYLYLMAEVYIRK